MTRVSGAQPVPWIRKTVAGSPMGCSISICGDPLGAAGNTDGGAPGGGPSAGGVDAAGLAPVPRACQPGAYDGPGRDQRRGGGHGRHDQGEAAPVPRRRGGCYLARGLPGVLGALKRAPVGGRRRERHLRAERRLVSVGAGAAAGGLSAAAGSVPGAAAVLPVGAAAGGLGVAVGQGAGGLPGAVLVSADDGHRRGGQVGVRRTRPGRGGGEGPELVEQRGRRGPLARAAGQARGDDAVQFRGQPGQVGRLGRELDQHVHDRLPLVGGVPGGGERQRRAEREHVARRRRLPGVPRLLGGHVGGRADGPAGDGELDPLCGPGHPEVDHPGPVRRDEHVGRLQVPVHQTGAVDRFQRLRAPGREPSGRRDRQRAALGTSWLSEAPGT